MSVADSLYAQGNARYQAGEYAAAESLFRQLLDVVSRDDGKAYGRAAYSLALTLIRQSQPDEAKRALHVAIMADPGLQRARDQLAKLEQTPTSPTTSGGIVGAARSVRMGSEPHPLLGQQRNPTLSFRVEAQVDGRPVIRTIMLSGARIEGSVEEGDTIEIPGRWRSGGKPNYVLNLTTGETVRAGSSGTRIAQFVILIAFLIGFVVFVMFGISRFS